MSESEQISHLVDAKIVPSSKEQSLQWKISTSVIQLIKNYFKEF